MTDVMDMNICRFPFGIVHKGARRSRCIPQIEIYVASHPPHEYFYIKLQQFIPADGCSADTRSDVPKRKAEVQLHIENYLLIFHKRIKGV